MSKIIGITGHKGSGKSTLANFLVENHGYTRIRFAGPLKAMMRQVGLGEREIEGDLKETPSDLLCGQTPRMAMQTLGTEWGRDIIGKDFWIRVWEASACACLDEGGKVVVDDVRFANEAEAIRRLGGDLVRIDRLGCRGDAHASEAEVDSLEVQAVVANHGEIDHILAWADLLADGDIVRGTADHVEHDAGPWEIDGDCADRAWVRLNPAGHDEDGNAQIVVTVVDKHLRDRLSAAEEAVGQIAALRDAGGDDVRYSRHVDDKGETIAWSVTVAAKNGRLPDPSINPSTMQITEYTMFEWRDGLWRGRL